MYERMGLIREFEERLKTAGRARRAGRCLSTSTPGRRRSRSASAPRFAPRDWIASTHRGHGHCIAKGVDVRPMMAELYGKATGTNRGKGGSMHITDVRVGMLGVNPIVGMGMPHAVGAALSARVRGTDEIAVAFFGEGATSMGVVHESMNLAAIWSLPVVFVCENNGYAQATPVEYAVAGRSHRRPGCGLPACRVSPSTARMCSRSTRPPRRRVARARAGGGPSFVECMTYRYYGHHQGDEPLRYRTADEERAGARARLPAPPARVPPRLRASPAGELDEIDARNRGRLDEAIAFAEASPRAGSRTSSWRTSTWRIPLDHGGRTAGVGRGAGADLQPGDQRRPASRDAERPAVIVLGEDVAGAAGRAHLGLSDAWGGPLRATRGLIGEFGPERVIDTPISEMAFVGAAIGAAMTGLRPVVEIMFADLIGCCYDQIINQAAKMHYMMGGQVDLPLVIRTAYGMHGFKRSYGGGAAAQHSQTLYAVLAHIPGLKVVVPSTAYNAKGLTLAAIRDNGPVVVIEHKFLGSAAKGQVPEESTRSPIGHAEIVRPGHRRHPLRHRPHDPCLPGGGRNARRRGNRAPRWSTSLRWPRSTRRRFSESVQRTHRLVVVDEDTPTASIGAGHRGAHRGSGLRLARRPDQDRDRP